MTTSTAPAVVVLAAVINALQVVGKRFEDVKVVFSGAGASGIACAQILQEMGTTNIVLVDSRGAIYKGRDNLNSMKEKVAETTNHNMEKGSMHDVIKGADMFIGLSTKDLIGADDVRKMNSDAIVLAMANPDPEIMPDEAERGGARVIGTGRSDMQKPGQQRAGVPRHLPRRPRRPCRAGHNEHEDRCGPGHSQLHRGAHPRGDHPLRAEHSGGPRRRGGGGAGLAG